MLLLRMLVFCVVQEERKEAEKSCELLRISKFLCKASVQLSFGTRVDT